MADDLPKWNLNIIGCWRFYCSTRKQKCKEKDKVWPEDCSKISSWGSERREKIRHYSTRGGDKKEILV